MLLIQSAGPSRNEVLVHLRNLRHDVIAVNSMLEAVVELRTLHPMVVVIDTSLPDDEGIALAYGMEDLAAQETRIVLMDEDSELRYLARNLPNAVFLKRPCTQEALGRAINELTRQDKH